MAHIWALDRRYKMRSISLKNPCKYCITRPVCKKVCKDHIEYTNGIEMVIGTFILLSIIFIVTWFSLLLWDAQSVIAKYSVIAFWILCYYFGIVAIIKEDAKTFSDAKIYQQALIILFSPWGEFTINVIDFLNLDKPVDKFCYRYIKHILHSKNKETDTRKAC